MEKAVSVLKYVLSLGLAGVLLYFAFRNIDFAEFVEKSKSVDYNWVILSIALSVAAYYARAYRWNLLIAPLGYSKLSIHRTTVAILVGYLANLAFPRLGEVTRCGVLNRSDQVPVSSSFGTVVTERVIDMLTLVVILLVTMIAEYDRLMSFFLSIFSDFENIEGLIWKSILTLEIAGVLGLGLLYVLYVKIPKVKVFIKSLIEGLISLRHVTNIWGFFLSTLILWVTYYFMSYLIVFAMPETAHLPWMAGVMLLITGGIALAIPVQGGIGTYHAFVSAMLVLYGVDKTTGVFLATLLHTSQLLAIAGFGGIGLLIAFLMKSKKSIQTDEQETNP